MLGEPETPVAEPLRLSGKIERASQRLLGARALDDRREVEDRKRRQRHRASLPLGNRPAARFRCTSESADNVDNRFRLGPHHPVWMSIDEAHELDSSPNRRSKPGKI